MKIEKLTKRQEAMLPRVRDEWLRIGLSTEPADRADAEAGVREAYAAAGLAAPSLFIWPADDLKARVEQLEHLHCGGAR
jgi:hypothetical protein